MPDAFHGLALHLRALCASHNLSVAEALTLLRRHLRETTPASEATKARNTRRYRQRIADGKCASCGGTPEPGRVRCRRCLDKIAERRQASYERALGKPYACSCCGAAGHSRTTCTARKESAA